MRFNDLIATVGRLFECIEGVNSSVQQSERGAPKKMDPSPLKVHQSLPQRPTGNLMCRQNFWLELNRLRFENALKETG
jgi:hypothetical protein